MVVSSHDIVKQLLEDYTEYELKYFSIVLFEGRKHYLCLSKHSMFLVSPGSEEESKLTNKEQIYLAWIKEVVVDTEDPMVFKIVLEERASKYIETPIRSEILNELQVFWKTDYMIRLRCVKEFPISHSVLDFPGKSKRKGAEFTRPPPGMKKVSHQGYFFWIKEDWEEKVDEEGDGWSDSQSVTFHKKGSDALLRFTAHPALKVANLARRERLGLRLTAERLAREHVGGGEDFVVINSDDHRKKMNLTGDPSTWKCYAAHMRTATRDVGVIVARRKFIPPFADSAQDLVWTLLGPTGYYDTSSFIDPLERIVDCVSAENQNFFFDSLVIRAKLDGLMCDEESFAWYQAHLQMSPVMIAAVRAFVLSSATLLEEAGADIVATELEPEATLFNNPFEIIDDMNKVGPDIEPDSEPEIVEGWRRKVSRFLAYCVDGGLHSELKLNDFVKVAQNQSVDEKRRGVVERLLEYFLYIRPRNGEYTPDLLKDKILDDQLMEAFTVNERLLCRLMELGYIQYVVDEDPEMYDIHCHTQLFSPENFVDFLLVLLKRSIITPELQSAALAQIALISQKEGEAKAVMVEKGVVGVLLDILSKSEDDLSLLSCVKALVNISANNNEAKDTIVNGSVIKTMVPHLGFNNEDLAFALSSLLKNCMNTEPHREVIGRAGVIPALVELLKTSQIPSGRSSEKLRAAAASALWNIAANASNVSRIVKSGGLDRIVSLLKRTKAEPVLEKLAGCIMVVCSNNDDVKKQIFELGAVGILARLLTSTRNIVLLRNVCGALAFLSTNQDVLFALRQERIEDGLEIAMKSKEKHIRVFAEQILDSLHGS